MQTKEANKDTLLTKTDRTGKREFREEIWSFKKDIIIVKKLNTRPQAKFPAAILKNPYYTPCNTAHIIAPPM
jgi:hypothetical protein